MFRLNKREHFQNYTEIAKVLSLLKTLPCDSPRDIEDINCTRRMLLKLQTQEYEKDMEAINRTITQKLERGYVL